MLPKAPQTAQGDLFKSELIAIIDSNHPLVRLADKIDWQQFEKSLHPTYVPGKGAPAINTRLMVALHILKFQHNLRDQAVVDRWVENPYWQFFSGMRFFSHQPPVDPSSMTRWRTRLGESGSEEILKASLQTALKVGAARESDFKDINVDTTVQTKDIRHPTDSRLYHRVLERLVKTARKEGFVIKQSYVRVGKRLLMMQGRYAHARQMNRAKGGQRKLRTKLGRVIREVERQAPGANTSTAEVLILAQHIHQQERSDRGKIYSVHEPLVECIAKGKVSKKYEFGSKVSVAVSSEGNWVMGAKSLSGNPYDGHTLSGQLEQVRNMVGAGVVERVFVDQGYRGHGSDGPEQVHVHRRRRGNIQRRLWRLMKRRAAIEPIIGHMKSEHRLERNRLKGTLGDKVNALLSAAAMNFTKLIAWLKFFLSFLRALFSFGIPHHPLIQTAKPFVLQDHLLGKWFLDYNRLKPYKALGELTPLEVPRPEDTSHTGKGGSNAKRNSESDEAEGERVLQHLPLRHAPGLQAAKRRKLFQRKQSRLAKQHPSRANANPYSETGVLGSATPATSPLPSSHLGELVNPSAPRPRSPPSPPRTFSAGSCKPLSFDLMDCSASSSFLRQRHRARLPAISFRCPPEWGNTGPTKKSLQSP